MVSASGPEVTTPRRSANYLPLSLDYATDQRIVAAGLLGEVLWLRLLAMPSEDASRGHLTGEPCVLTARAAWYAGEVLAAAGHPNANAARLVRQVQSAGLLTETWTEDFCAAYIVVRDGLALPAAVAEGETLRRAPIPYALRVSVYQRDGFRCVTCGSNVDLSLDHIYPWSLGGSDTFDNLQTLCRPCNSRKGAKV